MQTDVGGDEAEPAGVEGGEHAGPERVAEGQDPAKRSQMLVRRGGEGGRSNHEGTAGRPGEERQEHDRGQRDGSE